MPLRTSLPFLIATMLAATFTPCHSETVANAPNSEAIEALSAGSRTDANAAWWGFDPEDSTEAIQSAIDSGAATVTIPYVGQPWIVRPITLRGNLELILEPGVLVLAKKDEFHGRGDSLFRATDMTDITIRGYGATLRMRKKDYQSEAYERAEWRMGVAIVGCKRVTIEGLRVESSGGDGFYVGSSGKNRWSEDVTIRDCVSHDNHRQGLSVISAQDLLVENCTFSGTSGTPPEAGIDLEPDSADERLVNCVIRNCVFENNSGHQILVYLKPLTNESEPVSIRFENCHSRMGIPGMTLDNFTDMNQRGWSGMSVGAVGDNGPQGSIEFINCTSENTGKEGTKVFDKSAKGARVRFVNCSWTRPWVSAFRDYGGLRVPVLLHLRRPEITQNLGGVDFENCHVYDAVARPTIAAWNDAGAAQIHDVTGTIVVHNSAGASTHFGVEPQNVSLIVETSKD